MPFGGSDLPPDDSQCSNQRNGEIDSDDTICRASHHDGEYRKERMNLQFVPHYSR